MTTAERHARMAELRPLLTQVLHVVVHLPLIDCARIANRTVDELEHGNPEQARNAVAFFDDVLAAHDGVH